MIQAAVASGVDVSFSYVSAIHFGKKTLPLSLIPGSVFVRGLLEIYLVDISLLEPQSPWFHVWN